MDVKTCKTCQKSLDISEFYSNGFQPSGKKKYKPNCKKCEEEVRRAAKLDKVEQVLAELGKKLECEKCGYNRNFAALSFHHNDPSKKDFALSELSKTASKEKLKSEISKCSVLCMNCHMEEHYPHYVIGDDLHNN